MKEISFVALNCKKIQTINALWVRVLAEIEVILLSPNCASLTNKLSNIMFCYRAGETLDGLSLPDVYRAKELVDSAFHPDTGEKMFVIGRMSAQVPMNMAITGCLVTFYK